MTNALTAAAVPLHVSDDGEPRVLDITLAEHLGFTRPRDIRKIIARHLTSLEAIGTVRHRGAAIIGGKGAVQHVTEYYLTMAQAAFICAKSQTRMADNCTILMAQVFAAYKQGKLTAITAEAAAELEAHERAHQTRAGLICAEEREARAEAFAIIRRR